MKAEKKKREGKAKGGFFACFGPPPYRIVDKHREGERPSGPSLVSRERSSRWSSRWPSLLMSSRGEEEEEEGALGEAGRSERFSRRALAKVVRSVVIVASVEKSRGDNSRQRQQPLPREEKGTDLGTGFCSSSPSSVTSTSSSINNVPNSALSALSKEPMEPPRKPPPGGGSRGGGAMGLYHLLLLILIVVIFWGRLAAIIWASTCLCFAPRRGVEGAATGRVEKPEGEMEGMVPAWR